MCCLVWWVLSSHTNDLHVEPINPHDEQQTKKLFFSYPPLLWKTRILTVRTLVILCFLHEKKRKTVTTTSRFSSRLPRHFLTQSTNTSFSSTPRRFSTNPNAMLPMTQDKNSGQTSFTFAELHHHKNNKIPETCFCHQNSLRSILVLIRWPDTREIESWISNAVISRCCQHSSLMEVWIVWCVDYNNIFITSIKISFYIVTFLLCQFDRRDFDVNRRRRKRFKRNFVMNSSVQHPHFQRVHYGWVRPPLNYWTFGWAKMFSWSLQ